MSRYVMTRTFSGDKTADTLKGAILGGVIGNNVGNVDNGGAIGAIIGGMIGHNNSNASGGTKRSVRRRLDIQRRRELSILTLPSRLLTMVNNIP